MLLWRLEPRSRLKTEVEIEVNPFVHSEMTQETLKVE